MSYFALLTLISGSRGYKIMRVSICELVVIINIALLSGQSLWRQKTPEAFSSWSVPTGTLIARAISNLIGWTVRVYKVTHAISRRQSYFSSVDWASLESVVCSEVCGIKIRCYNYSYCYGSLAAWRQTKGEHTISLITISMPIQMQMAMALRQ